MRPPFIQSLGLVLVLGLPACDSPSEAAGSADASDVQTSDAGTSPDALAAQCDDIVATSDDLATWRSTIVAWLRERGSTGATDDGSSIDRASVRGFREAIPRGAPQSQTIAWLAGLPEFMVPAAELTLIEFKSVVAGSATVVIGRANVGGTDTAFREPLAVVQLLGSGTSWEAMSMSVWPHVALVSARHAGWLAACTPSAPPPTTQINRTPLEGLSMRGCGIVGSYTYTPRATDHVVFDAEVDWVVVTEQDGTRHWRFVRDATLTVAPTNYWSNYIEADAYCGSTVGFELEVDARSGEIVRYTPGINCVVC